MHNYAKIHNLSRGRSVRRKANSAGRWGKQGGYIPMASWSTQDDPTPRIAASLPKALFQLLASQPIGFSRKRPPTLYAKLKQSFACELASSSDRKSPSLCLSRFGRLPFEPAAIKMELAGQMDAVANHAKSTYLCDFLAGRSTTLRSSILALSTRFSSNSTSFTDAILATLARNSSIS